MTFLRSLILTLPFYSLIYGFQGFTTEYGEDTTNKPGGACGFPQVWGHGLTLGAKLNVAMNPQQFEDGMNCGRCLKIQNGANPPIIAMVTNLNPPSPYQDMDMARATYAALTVNGPSGHIPITWDWVRCPKDFVDGPMYYYIDSIATKWYFAIMPQNFPTRIEKMEIFTGGKWYDMKHQGPFHRFLAPWGVTQVPYKLRSTFIDGTSVTTGEINSMAQGTYVGDDGKVDSTTTTKTADNTDTSAPNSDTTTSSSTTKPADNTETSAPDTPNPGKNTKPADNSGNSAPKPPNSGKFSQVSPLSVDPPKPANKPGIFSVPKPATRTIPLPKKKPFVIKLRKPKHKGKKKVRKHIN